MPQEPRTSHKEAVSDHLDDGENTSQQIEEGKQPISGYINILLFNGKAVLLIFMYRANHCALELGMNSYPVSLAAGHIKDRADTRSYQTLLLVLTTQKVKGTAPD